MQVRPAENTGRNAESELSEKTCHTSVMEYPRGPSNQHHCRSSQGLLAVPSSYRILG